MSERGDCNVASFLERRAGEAPERTALVVPGGNEMDEALLELDYRALATRVANWRARFAGAGVGAGTRVLLLVPMGVPLIEINFALLGLGASPVVIDPGMGLRSFLRCVRQTGPEAMAAISKGHWLARLLPGAFRETRIRVRVDTAPPAPPSGLVPPLTNPEPGDRAAILFTSGSTGPAKGVVYTHGAFRAQVDLVRETFGIAPGEVDFPMLPIFSLFDPALGMTTVVPPMNPSRPASADPAAVSKAMLHWKVTNSFGSPALWRRLAGYAGPEKVRFPDLRRILIAGAPVGPGVLRELRSLAPSAKIHTPYGATECLPVATIEADEILSETSGASARGLGTCVGRAVAGVSIRVVKPVDGSVRSLDDFEPCPPGVRGEIVVSGPTVTREYYGLPEATSRAKTFDADGRIWHRMGDIGYRDDQERLWFCGRVAERVTDRKGRVLDTESCEAIANAVPGVWRSALIPLAAGGAGIVIEPDPQGVPDSAGRTDLRERVAKALAENPVTDGIEAVFLGKDFPVDVRHNAKINRRELARRVRQ